MSQENLQDLTCPEDKTFEDVLLGNVVSYFQQICNENDCEFAVMRMDMDRPVESISFTKGTPFMDVIAQLNEAYYDSELT